MFRLLTMTSQIVDSLIYLTEKEILISRIRVASCNRYKEKAAFLDQILPKNWDKERTLVFISNSMYLSLVFLSNIEITKIICNDGSSQNAKN